MTSLTQNPSIYKLTQAPKMLPGRQKHVAHQAHWVQPRLRRGSLHPPLRAKTTHEPTPFRVQRDHQNRNTGYQKVQNEYPQFKTRHPKIYRTTAPIQVQKV